MPSQNPNERGNLREKAVKALGWSAGQTIGSIGIQVATIIVLSRILSPGEVGVVATGMAFIAILTIFVELGVGPALIQRQFVDRAHIGTALCLSLVLGAVLATALYFSAAWLARLVKIDEIAWVLPFLSTIIVIQPLAGVLESLAKRELRFQRVATVNFLAMALGYCGLSVACALAGLGFWSLVAGYIAQVTLRFAFLMALSRQYWVLAFSKKALSDILSFGASFSIVRLSYMSANRLDRALLGSLLGAEAVGLYSRAQQLVELGSTVVGQPLGAVLFPIMARTQEDKTKLARAFRSSLTVVGLWALPATLMIIVGSKPLIPLVLGEHWSGLVSPLQILALGTFLRSFDGTAAALARAVAKVRERAAIQVLYAILVLSSVATLYKWGLDAVVFGVLGAMIINWLLMAMLSAKILGRSMLWVLAPIVPGLAVTLFLASLIGVSYLVLGSLAFSATGFVTYAILSGFLLLALCLLAPERIMTRDIVEIRSALIIKLLPRRSR